MEILKTLRKAKGLTQEELAERLGISRLMVNQYENGKSKPSRHTLVKMAEFFNCTLDYLWCDNYEIERKLFEDIDKSIQKEERLAAKLGIKTAIKKKQANRFEFFKTITELGDESKELFHALSVMSKEEIDFFKAITQLNEKELDDLTDYVDFLISKREKKEDEQQRN